MHIYHIDLNEHFIGRGQEQARLNEIMQSEQSSIIVMYGRRRVGKTELLEQTFRNRNVLKFEGIEGLTQALQIERVLIQLSQYVGDTLIAKLNFSHWADVFQLIAKYVQQGEWTVYFEEIQWLANYQTTFIAELKYAWDNFFRHNSKLILVLCGSAPSFIINHVLGSKSLYNRSQYEFLLKELNLIDSQKLLKNKAHKEVMDAYLTVGGIPEYLNRLQQGSSVFLSLCKNSFVENGFFSHEYARIFTSQMSSNKHYKAIIDFLSKQKFATRAEIARHLKLKSGGGLSSILIDLEQCNFIQKYSPYNLSDDSLIARYAIDDAYLQFYFKFIAPHIRDIKQGVYNVNPTMAINTDSYNKWLGFSFERFCRKYHYVIAKILGFSAVQYKSGAFFNREVSLENPGYQIDLIFDRADHVLTICEIKYLKEKASKKVATDFAEKLSLLPNKKNKTIQKILISTHVEDKQLMNAGYFDNVVILDDFFNEIYWR